LLPENLPKLRHKTREAASGTDFCKVSEKNRIRQNSMRKDTCIPFSSEHRRQNISLGLSHGQDWKKLVIQSKIKLFSPGLKPRKLTLFQINFGFEFFLSKVFGG
jgi:hypothetical protein